MAASAWADVWSGALSWLQVTSVFFPNWKIHERTQSFWRREHYLDGRWLAERPRTTILLQRNENFVETLDQVHFSCKRIMSQSDKIWCAYLVVNCVGLLTFLTLLVLIGIGRLLGANYRPTDNQSASALLVHLYAVPLHYLLKCPNNNKRVTVHDYLASFKEVKHEVRPHCHPALVPVLAVVTYRQIRTYQRRVICFHLHTGAAETQHTWRCWRNGWFWFHPSDTNPSDATDDNRWWQIYRNKHNAQRRANLAKVWQDTTAQITVFVTSKEVNCSPSKWSVFWCGLHEAYQWCRKCRHHLPQRRWIYWVLCGTHHTHDLTDTRQTAAQLSGTSSGHTPPVNSDDD